MSNEYAKKSFHTAIRLDGCNPQDLVDISSQFAALELDIPLEIAPLVEKKTGHTSDRSDWNAVANALGNVYQALCNNECTAALNAMQAIERILLKRDIKVPQPTNPIRTSLEEELPIETEFNYDE